MRADPVVCGDFFALLSAGIRCRGIRAQALHPALTYRRNDIWFSPGGPSNSLTVPSLQSLDQHQTRSPFGRFNIKLTHLCRDTPSKSLTFENIPPSKTLTENRIPMI